MVNSVLTMMKFALTMNGFECTVSRRMMFPSPGGGLSGDPTVKSQLSNPNCQIPTAKSQLSNPNCQIPTVKSQLSNPNCQIPTAKSQLPNPRRTASQIRCTMKVRNFVLKPMNCSFKMMDFALKMMNFAQKRNRRRLSMPAAPSLKRDLNPTASPVLRSRNAAARAHLEGTAHRGSIGPRRLC